MGEENPSIVECGTDFTNTYGNIDMKFYDSMTKMAPYQINMASQ